MFFLAVISVLCFNFRRRHQSRVLQVGAETGNPWLGAEGQLKNLRKIKKIGQGTDMETGKVMLFFVFIDNFSVHPQQIEA